MNFINSTKDEKIVIVNCDCGCNQELHIKKYIDEDINNIEYYITFSCSKFDEEQQTIFGIIKKRLKRAWYSLRGKDYRYFELFLNQENFRDLQDKIKNM